MTQEFTCPSCQKTLEIQVFRWDSVAVCPACYQHLRIAFDFTVGEDENEYDIYEIISISDKEFFERQGVYGGIGDSFSETKLLP